MSARWIFTKVSFLPARRSLRNDHTAQPREKRFPRRIVSVGAHRRKTIATGGACSSFQFPLRYECEIITAPFFVFRRFNVFVANILPFPFSSTTDRYKFPWKIKRAGAGGSETCRNINVTCRDWSLEYQVYQGLRLNKGCIPAKWNTQSWHAVFLFWNLLWYCLAFSSFMKRDKRANYSFMNIVHG